MEIKQPYTSIRLNGNSLILKKDDGTSEVLNMQVLESLVLSGSITGKDGDQAFFDMEDPSSLQPTTDISNIARNWRKDYKDFNLARIAMATVLGNNFENISTFDKRIVSRWFLTTYENRLTVINENEDKDNWQFLLIETKIARDRRIEAARRAISYELVTSDASDLFDTLANHISGFSIANKPDLIQWITNTGNYISKGFTQKGYYTAGRKNLLVDILQNGIY